MRSIDKIDFLVKIKSVCNANISKAIVEQGINGLSNVALVALFSRSASVEDTGKFAIVIVVLQVAILFARGFASTIVIAVQIDEYDFSGGAMLTLLLGVFSSFLVFYVASALEFAEANLVVLFLVAIVLPYQDYLRHICFRKGFYGHALIAALIWIIVMFFLYFIFSEFQFSSFDRSFTAWACGGFLATVLLYRTLKIIPSLYSMRQFCKKNRSMQLTMCYEQLVGSSIPLVTVFIVSGLGSLSHVGLLRIAQVAASPIAVVIQGLYSFAIPKISNNIENSKYFDTNFTKLEKQLFTMVLASGVGYGFLFFTIESRLGEVIFGASWSESSLLAYCLLLATIFAGFATASISLLRGLNATSVLINIRTVTTIIFLLIQTLGYKMYGLTGLGMFSVFASIVGLFIWLHAKNKHIASIK